MFIVFYWKDFATLETYALLYQWFRPVSYRLTVTLDPSKNTYGVLACLPINYEIETSPASLALSVEYISSLRDPI